MLNTGGILKVLLAELQSKFCWIKLDASKIRKLDKPGF